MATIQVEVNGILRTCTKEQLFNAATNGRISPQTILVVDGQRVKASQIKGIPFPTPTSPAEAPNAPVAPLASSWDGLMDVYAAAKPIDPVSVPRKKMEGADTGKPVATKNKKTKSRSEPIFIGWWLECFKKYFDFSGRARRKEYWIFTLVSTLIFFGLLILTVTTGSETGEPSAASGIFAMGYSLYALISFIPTLAVLVRRLHDGGNSGFMFFINFVPMIGSIILLVFLLRDSEKGVNQYGPSPKR